ncbi:hypothetical protein E3N88_27728 [Mikania micrantha]|uniref:Uncharacterized protein n=1 Tax=Mikania micrantha TaxID=192012 RepID=A0A5N6MYL3_9ASTR|nr:hypothetical protein E3N88_27728 [Mikania micrantha]
MQLKFLSLKTFKPHKLLKINHEELVDGMLLKTSPKAANGGWLIDFANLAKTRQSEKGKPNTDQIEDVFGDVHEKARQAALKQLRVHVALLGAWATAIRVAPYVLHYLIVSIVILILTGFEVGVCNPLNKVTLIPKSLNQPTPKYWISSSPLNFSDLSQIFITCGSNNRRNSALHNGATTDSRHSTLVCNLDLIGRFLVIQPLTSNISATGTGNRLASLQH